MQATNFGQRVYKMRGWQRTLYLVLGLLLCCVGAFIVYLARQNGQSGLPVAVAIIPLIVGSYLLLLALRSRLVIDRDHIEVQDAFREQYAELSDIEGFRTVSTRNGSYWRLQRKQGGRAIIIQKWFDCDDLRAWLRQLTDLDEVGRNALLDEIRQD